MAIDSEPRDAAPPVDSPASYIDFERVSRGGELLIVFFYAEAYEEAVNNALNVFKSSGDFIRPILLFTVFFAVTVRFFIGNFFHLSDTKWKDKWHHSSTRGHYFFDSLVIVLESLAMIVLGSFDVAGSTVVQIVATLMIISGIDCIWILLRFGIRWRHPHSCPVDLGWAWFRLNAGVFVLCWIFLGFFRGHPLTACVLGSIVAINLAAFTWDMILTSGRDPWKLKLKKKKAVAA